MAKVQSYSITFNTAQTSPEDAMATVGGSVNSAIREHIQEEILLGGVIENTLLLSADGLTLTVERTFTDAAYNDLMSIASESEILALIEGVTEVSSATYGFSDA